MSNLFKERLKLNDVNDYVSFISDSLKPFGFGTELDDQLNNLKFDLFNTLYHAAKNGGPSFDSEILLNSFIDDINGVFHEVAGFLLHIQRQNGQ